MKPRVSTDIWIDQISVVAACGKFADCNVSSALVIDLMSKNKNLCLEMGRTSFWTQSQDEIMLDLQITIIHQLFICTAYLRI